MRKHGQGHHDRDYMQDQKRVAWLRHWHLHAPNYFVVDPTAIVSCPHQRTYGHQQPEPASRPSAWPDVDRRAYYHGNHDRELERVRECGECVPFQNAGGGNLY